MAKIKPTANEWILKVEQYKNIRNKMNRNIKAIELTKNQWGLPSANWFVINSPYQEVKTYNDFVIWCGYIPNINITKEQAIKIILDMQNKLDRPIMASDFNSPKSDEIGIRSIIRIWGEVWKMQSELGLQITGKHATLSSITECKTNLLNLCNEIYLKENRNVISYKDIRKCINLGEPSTCTRILKEDGLTIRQFLKENNFDLVSEGNGLNYIFKDGEKVKSQYELEFSQFLRSIGMIYNKDYIRDIKYKYITDKNLKLNINCDYQIKIGSRIFYVELAGMLCQKQHYDAYENNVPINSKSKENYRQKLNIKRNLFKNYNLEYYILLPYEMNNDVYNFILFHNKEGVA